MLYAQTLVFILSCSLNHIRTAKGVHHKKLYSNSPKNVNRTLKLTFVDHNVRRNFDTRYL